MMEKKDKWMDVLQDKMENFEMDAPEGLQECLNLYDCVPEFKKTVSKWHLRWNWRIISVAASILVLLSLSLFLMKDDDYVTDLKDTSLLTQEGIGERSVETLNAEKVIPPSDFIKDGKAETNINAASAQMLMEEVCKEAIVDNDGGRNPLSHTDSVKDRFLDQKSVAAEMAHKSPNKRNRGDARYSYTMIEPSRNKDGNIYVGAYTTGGLHSDLKRISTGNAGISTLGPEETEWKDDPMLGILVFNRGKEVKTDIHHRQPIRAGISIGYRISNHMMIESGLTYANLTSDIKSGSENHYYTGEQVLHYIGIPVSVRYDFLKWKRLSLYAAGGILAEKNISGKTELNYFIDNIKEKTETNEITEHPVQLSVNLTPGVEVSITDRFGVFAEPGVSYYINNKSSVKNIYKEKPLNFNLNFGFRFTIGR